MFVKELPCSPFDRCENCKFSGCGQANMPCRACVFGSKFESALTIRDMWPTTILENMDVASLYPTHSLAKIKDKMSIHPNVISDVIHDYCKHDVETTKKMYDIMNRRMDLLMNRKTIPEIKNVEFNPPLTVVIWKDGTKTFVKAHGGETFDPEKGLAMAICKRLYDNKYSYTKVFDRWIDKYEKKVRKERFANIDEMHLYGGDNIKKAAEQATAAINRATKAISDAVGNKHEKI